MADLLVELYGRLAPLAAEAVESVDATTLRTAPTEGANTIAWLVWHTARVQDHHVAELMGVEQRWVSADWAPRFGLAADPDNTGYGHSPAEVLAVVPREPADLLEYLNEVQARTTAWLASLRDDDLDRVVDRRWDPPVTLAVRLVSVADDGLQHLGQAAYVAGLLRE